MVFVPPSWFEGLLIWILMIAVPVLIGATAIAYAVKRKTQDAEITMMAFALGAVALFVIVSLLANVVWFEAYEVPSVSEKIITVKEWQPTPGSHSNGDGQMEISNAGELMVITTDGEGFFNQENLFFQKFNTRDIFNQMRVNGTYKIKYYGWRNGFNSGFPNILSVEEVVNENGTVPNEYNKYFGVKLAV